MSRGLEGRSPVDLADDFDNFKYLYVSKVIFMKKLAHISNFRLCKRRRKEKKKKEKRRGKKGKKKEKIISLNKIYL